MTDITPEDLEAARSAPTYPYTENDIEHVSPELSVTHGGGALKFRGEVYVRQSDVVQPVSAAPAKSSDPFDDPISPLSEFKTGEYVNVQKNGVWLPGKVGGIEKGPSTLLYVDTERGPVTVASTHIIRKIVKG